MNYKMISAIGIGALAFTSLSGNFIGRREGAPKEQEPFANMLESNLDDYISDAFGITFKYPASWNKNPRYEDKYEGKSGFFEVSGYESNKDNIDSAVQEEIDEPYMPYGSKPTIKKLIVDGQPAREIIPSADQGDIITDRDTALVVQYKTPVTVEGKTYPYLIIWTNKDNLPLIIRSLKFIQYGK